MDFQLTEEQVALQDAIRSFCQANYSFEIIASLDDDPLRLDNWQRLTDLDVFRVAAPVNAGGLGLGVVESAVVFEVLGSHLVPGPLVWTALAAQYLAEDLDGQNRSDQNRTGQNDADQNRAGSIIGGLDRPPTGSEPVLLEYGAQLSGLIVLGADGVRLVDIRSALRSPEHGSGSAQDAPTLESVPSTDPLTPVALASHLPDGSVVADGSTADAVRTAGTVLTSALLVGLADRAVQAAVAYTSERQQFDRPVGSFQAVQHLIADMYVRASLARSATYGAAAIIDGLGAGDPSVAAANAKLLAADAALRNARSCIQVHGGMGFTWEMIPHYLHKRAWVLEHSFGTRAEHAEAVATALDREVA